MREEYDIWEVTQEAPRQSEIISFSKEINDKNDDITRIGVHAQLS